MTMKRWIEHATMNAWVTSLTTIGQGTGRSKTAFLHVLLPVVLQSLAIYYAYRALRWAQNRRHGTNQGALSSVDMEPGRRKDPNRDREPGGMSDRDVKLQATDTVTIPIYPKHQSLGPPSF